MNRVTIFLSLGLITLGTACAQNKPVAEKRTYHRGLYTQTGSNIPSTYRDYSNDNAMQSEQQRQQLDNLRNNGSQSMTVQSPSGGR